MEFDVIVVGAGSAGCALAARVTENPRLSVALVEAGPDYLALNETPEDLRNSHNNSYRDHDWGLSYAPTRGRTVPFPRGRVTGGSSAVNTTIALRGVPEDYDGWAALGNDAWRWDEVLPAFNRLERDLDYGDTAYHGDAGPIPIRRYPHEELLPQHQAFLATAEQIGYPSCPDANDPQDWGAGPQPMNKLGRLRISCAIGYLAPARLRDNLHILPNLHVNKLVTKGGRAAGIEALDTHGNSQVIGAKLVVLCAGALMTPTILLRSGIGSKAGLAKAGVAQQFDVPGVGENLADHPALSVVCAVKPGVQIDHDAPIIQTILRYTAEGSDQRNDLQIEQLSFAGRPGGPALFAVAAVLEQQDGRGQLWLESDDPYAAPVVDNRFCENDHDRQRLVSCLKDTLRFTETGPLADMIDQVTFPDPARGTDDESLHQLARRFSGSGYHPCGTAKMGPKEDPLAVVDQYGRSHAVDQLVVADASIMPAVPRANTNLTAIMIGEKVGEWLRTQPTTYGL